MAVARTISPAVRRAALFPHDDLPDPPPDHPYKQIRRPGYVIGMFPGATFGTVAVTAIEPDALDPAVKDVREVLVEHGMRRGAWMIVDAAAPPDLVARLETLGMTPSDEPPFEPHMSTLVLTAAPKSAPVDVEARLAETLEEFVDAHRIAADAFDFNDDDRAAFEAKNVALWELEQRDGKYRTYVALSDGEVIGFAAVVFGANAVYLSGGGTRADHRGRGAYRALVRARWETAVARGTPALTVGAGGMSGPILERLGFERVGRIDCLLDKFD
jgi:GNAT superfamily N-acetyltransferase